MRSWVAAFASLSPQAGDRITSEFAARSGIGYAIARHLTADRARRTLFADQVLGIRRNTFLSDLGNALHFGFESAKLKIARTGSVAGGFFAWGW
jgi:hypothetical protein